ncbi:MAG: flagellar motor protein MotB [Negativicutes bacterium]|nr:flagellar motor protein MotB [Negativicutes bacterium]
MSRRKSFPEHHEDHSDETWLIPYADILTLLLALFIVLFASAQVDQKKFDQLRESFSNAFGSGSVSIFDSTRTPPNVKEGPPTQNQAQFPPSITLDEKQLLQKETAQLVEVKRMLDRYIQENNLTGGLETALVNEGLLIRIKDTALFGSGSAELLPQSRSFASEIAKLIAVLPQNVVISGHTDNVPINTAQFPTNWHLSSARALNFMLFILAQDSKVRPERFSSLGFGEFRPLASNQAESGRTQNRRVEILIVRKYQ